MTGQAQPSEQADQDLKPCPVCRIQSLGRHCQVAGCPWRSCRNLGCRAVLDLGARRGVRPGRGGWEVIRL